MLDRCRGEHAANDARAARSLFSRPGNFGPVPGPADGRRSAGPGTKPESAAGTRSAAARPVHRDGAAVALLQRRGRGGVTGEAKLVLLVRAALGEAEHDVAVR